MKSPENVRAVIIDNRDIMTEPLTAIAKHLASIEMIPLIVNDTTVKETGDNVVADIYNLNPDVIVIDDRLVRKDSQWDDSGVRLAEELRLKFALPVILMSVDAGMAKIAKQKNLHFYNAEDEGLLLASMIYDLATMPRDEEEQAPAA